MKIGNPIRDSKFLVPCSLLSNQLFEYENCFKNNISISYFIRMQQLKKNG